jgi:hypothetical protein
MMAEDWHGNDYATDVNDPESTVSLVGKPNFDGVNLYGDETRIPVPLPVPGYSPLDLQDERLEAKKTWSTTMTQKVSREMSPCTTDRQIN